MGIGAALATGLVQGFTQNINNEKARRQGERDKVDKYQEILMNASLNPGKNFSASNAKLLGSMIQNANNQLDDQERINLFGQQGEDLDIDFSGVLSQLQSAPMQIDGMTSVDFFGMSIPIAEKYEDHVGTNRGKSMLYSALNNHRIKNPTAFQDHFSQNPKLFKDARNDIMNLGKGTLRFASSNTKGDVPYTVNTSELPGYEEFFNKFFRIDKTAQFDQQFSAIKGMMEDKASENFNNPDLIPLSGSLFSERTSVVDATTGEAVKVTKSDMVPILWTDIEGMDETRWNNVGQVASIQGMSTPQFIYEFSKKQTNLQDFTSGINVVADLASLGAAKGNKRTNEDILMQGEYIANSAAIKDDVFLQANAFLAFQPLAMSKSEQDMIDAGISSDVTVGNPEKFKSQFENLIGITYAKFQTKKSGVTGAKEKLTRYREMVSQLPATSGSFISDVYRVIDSIFGPTGKIDQIVNIIDFGEDEYEGNGIAAFIDADRANRGLDAGDMITATDALAYIIAADLARAEDDQGRLSDADIQRNLNKIKGFGATKMTGQLAAIDEVMATIESQDKQLAVIDRIAENGMSTGSISRNDRRLLAADNQARKARLAYKNATRGIQTESETPTFTRVDEIVNNPDGIITIGKREDESNVRVFNIDGRYYKIFNNEVTELTVQEVQSLYDSMDKYFPESPKNETRPENDNTNSTNTEQNINQDKPSDDTSADVNNDPTPTNVDLIRGSEFLGMSRVPLGNNRYRFGDDPTIYEMVTRPNAAGQQATFYKKVN